MGKIQDKLSNKGQRCDEETYKAIHSKFPETFAFDNITYRE